MTDIISLTTNDLFLPIVIYTLLLLLLSFGVYRMLETDKSALKGVGVFVFLQFIIAILLIFIFPGLLIWLGI